MSKISLHIDERLEFRFVEALALCATENATGLHAIMRPIWLGAAGAKCGCYLMTWLLVSKKRSKARVKSLANSESSRSKSSTSSTRCCRHTKGWQANDVMRGPPNRLFCCTIFHAVQWSIIGVRSGGRAAQPVDHRFADASTPRKSLRLRPSLLV